MSDQPLDGKVIVVIGGTSGLGLSGAKACLAAGAKVVAVGRDTEGAEQARKELGDGAFVFAGDAGDPTTAPEAIQIAVREFTGFHGLYHVAGGSGRTAGDGPLHECTDAGWEYTTNLNLRTVFYSNRAAARHFMAQGGNGTVLNMSSVLAASPSPRYFATHAYAAAKAAIEGLTRASASYYASRDIRFNALAPGLVETRMARRASEDATILKFIASKQPLDGGRIGQPQDLDAAVVFFLSDASRFVTGQVLAIDGGWSLTEGQHPRDEY